MNCDRCHKKGLLLRAYHHDTRQIITRCERCWAAFVAFCRRRETPIPNARRIHA